MLKQKLLLIRPYSLPGLLALGILVHAIINKRIIPDFLLLDMLALCSAWGSINYLAEYLQRESDKRPHVSALFPLSLFFIFVITAVLRQPFSIVPYFFMLLTTLLYSSKTRNLPVSPFLFLFRGFVEVFMAVIVISQYDFTSIHNGLYNLGLVAPILYLLPTSRNLIGDIRDISADKFTFPVKFGITASYTASLFLLLPIFFLVSDVFSLFPLVLVAILILFRYNPYDLHKIFVLSTTFFLLNLCANVLNQDILLINIAYLAVISIPTYDAVPRKTNSIWKR